MESGKGEGKVIELCLWNKSLVHDRNGLSYSNDMTKGKGGKCKRIIFIILLAKSWHHLGARLTSREVL